MIYFITQGQDRASDQGQNRLEAANSTRAGLSHQTEPEQAWNGELHGSRSKSRPGYCLRFLSCPVPAVVKSQRNHTEVFVSYKLIGLVAQTSY